MKRIIFASLLILALLPTQPAAALTCVTLDLTESGHGWVVNYGAYIPSVGFVSNGGAYADTAYTDAYTITGFTAYYSVITPGANPGTNNIITESGITLANESAEIAAGDYSIGWSGTARTGGTMRIVISAPTGGEVAVTGVYICGEPLPTEWTGGSTSPFPEETPWARPTPTPWVIDDGENWAEPITFNNEDVGQFADTIINSYNFLNQNNVLDFAISAIMMLMIIGLLTRAIRGGKEL